LRGTKRGLEIATAVWYHEVIVAFRSAKAAPLSRSERRQFGETQGFAPRRKKSFADFRPQASL